MGRELYRDLDAVTASSVGPSGRAVAVAGGVPRQRALGLRQRLPARHLDRGELRRGRARERPRPGAGGAPPRRMCFLPAERARSSTPGPPRACAERQPRLHGRQPLRARGAHLRPRRAPVPAPAGSTRCARCSSPTRPACPWGSPAARSRAWWRSPRTRPRSAARACATRRWSSGRRPAPTRSSGRRGATSSTRVGDLWATLRTGDAPAPRQRARYRLRLAAACASCVEAVDLPYQVAGGTALYAPHPLDRAPARHPHPRPARRVLAQDLRDRRQPAARAGAGPAESPGTGCAAQPAGGHDVGAAPNRHPATARAAGRPSAPGGPVRVPARRRQSSLHRARSRPAAGRLRGPKCRPRGQSRRSEKAR